MPIKMLSGTVLLAGLMAGSLAYAERAQELVPIELLRIIVGEMTGHEVSDVVWIIADPH